MNGKDTERVRHMQGTARQICSTLLLQLTRNKDTYEDHENASRNLMSEACLCLNRIDTILASWSILLYFNRFVKYYRTLQII